MRPRTLDGTARRIISKEATNGSGRQGYLLYLTSSGFGFQRRLNDSYDTLFSTAVTPALHRAHHIAASYDGATMRLYVDGVLVGSRASAKSLVDHSGPLRLGTHSSGSDAFTGSLDEVAVYERALSSAEVAAHVEAGGGSYRGAVLDDSPASYWRFEDIAEAGAAIDETASGRTGTGCGQGTATGSLLATGSSHSAGFSSCGPPSAPGIGFGDTLDFAGQAPFTLEAWVRPRTLDGTARRIISKEATNGSGRQGYLLYLTSSGFGFQRRLNDSYDTLFSTAVTPALHRAHHIAASYDGATMRLYVDGVLVGSRASAKSLVDHSGPLRLGTHSSGSDAFTGSLDEVAVYERALSSAEVAAHVEAGGGSYRGAVLDDSPSSYWRFEDFTDGRRDRAWDEVGARTGVPDGCRAPGGGSAGRGIVTRACRPTRAACCSVTRSTSPARRRSRSRRGCARARSTARRGGSSARRRPTAPAARATCLPDELGLRLPAAPQRLLRHALLDDGHARAEPYPPLAATYDGVTMRLYVDGILVGSRASTKSLLDPAAQLQLGGNSVGTDAFRGTIDEVAVYDRALSGGEVAAHVEAGS